MKLFRSIINWFSTTTEWTPFQSTPRIVDPDRPDTSSWLMITEIKDLPSPDDLVKYGTWGDLIHLMKVLYTKNLELAKQNENRDPS